MLKRIATAVVLIAVMASVLLWAPVWLFKFLVILFSAGALAEYYRLVFGNDYFSTVTGLIFSAFFSGILITSGPVGWVIPLFLAAFFILVLLHMAYSTTTEGIISRLGLIVFGTVYLGFTLPAFVWLRGADHGRSLIVFTIAIVAVGDSFAYAVGKLFGRRKLAPLISPKKTIEGLIASFFGGVAASLICWQVFWKELPAVLIIFLGLSVALIGALGDLIESLIKRSYHVKDSGAVFPGHGGILDRLDALVFAAPFVYFTFRFLGWI